MATFYPTWNEIWNNKLEPPSEIEGILLRQLKELDDTYEVYFQTHVNKIAHPDFVLIRKGYGVLMIDVNEQDLDQYTYQPGGNEFGCLVEKGSGHQIKTPFQQVIDYKKAFYDQFCSALKIDMLENSRVFGLIKTVVYFPKAFSSKVDELYKDANFADLKRDKNNQYKYKYWAKGSPITDEIQNMLKWRNQSFTETIYEQVHSILAPSRERLEQGEPITLSKEQLRFAVSEPGRQQKIKGVAGSGKTLVLAQRAVNCHKRTQKPVLILTFNITLKGYIRDMIAQMSREEGWTEEYRRHAFVREHVHSFMGQMCELQMIPKEAYQNSTLNMDLMINALSRQKNRIMRKFQTILIDEVQDFEYEWLCAIKDLFLEKGGELVLFGDEKQNIYERSLDENRLPRTPIPGRWAMLKECYRLSHQNGALAVAFQKEFFRNKYEPSEMEYVQTNLDSVFSREESRYYELERMPLTLQREVSEFCQIVEQFRKDSPPVSPNDICILSEEYDMLREFEYYFRTELHLPTSAICETKEEFERISESEPKNLQRALNEIRRIRKAEFEMNPDAMKFCTVHSFKGWEINTIVLWVDGKSKNDELIYTALTRAKKNLVVVNYYNDRYRNFFVKNVKTYRLQQ